MAIVTLSDAKDYLHIDGTDSDKDVQRAVNSAEAYIAEYTKKTFTSACALAVECCLMLTQQFYDNRGGVMDGKFKAMEFGIINLLVNLKHMEAS